MQFIRRFPKVIKDFFSHNKIMLVLFLSALLIRLLYVVFFMQFPLIKDDLQYNMMAKNILEGKGFSYDSVSPTVARGPLYPLFLAGTYFIFGYDYNAARILQALIGAATCILIYFIGKKIYNSNIGFYAALISGIYPALIGYTGLLYSETLAALFVALTVLLYLLAANKKSLPYFMITGISSGLLILCYPKFLFMPVILSISILFFNKFRGEFFKYFLGLAVAAILVLTPWVIRNFYRFGELIPVATGSGVTLWHSTLAEDDTEWRFDKDPLLSEFKKFYRDPENPYEQHDFLFSVKTNDALMKEGLSNIRKNPLLFARLSLKRFFRQWMASNGNSFYALRGSMKHYLSAGDYGILSIKVLLVLLQICVIVFGFIGILSSFVSNRKNIFSPIFLAVFYSALINSVFMTQPRYQIPVLGLLFIYTASGMHWAFLRLSGRPQRGLAV